MNEHTVLKPNGLAKTYLCLHLALLLFSFAAVCSKLASASKEVLSLRFIGFFAISCIIQTIFLVVWQQILKKLPLSVAYTNRAVSIIWGMLWGVLLFNEALKLHMLIGAAIIIAGIVIVAGAKTE